MGSRRLEVDFTGGVVSSDGGGLLLRQVDRGLGVTRSLAACFMDRRDQTLVIHSVEELVRQRVYALALGYEDINDHEYLRRDPLLVTACDKVDVLQPGASAATLNRLELSNNRHSRGHKLQHNGRKIEQCLLNLAVRCLPKYARQIVLDLDSMGHLVHGLQEGRHFNAYYGDYCYRPLYIVAGDVVLWAQLRTSDRGEEFGVVAALQQVVAAVRQRCRHARIVVRGDSGFCLHEVLDWCEDNAVHYCIGVARNAVLVRQLEPTLARARADLGNAEHARRFTEFRYQAKTWRRSRRVIGKAEVMAKGDNPRFVVTSLPAKELSAQALYEQLYCARGEMENVLKQQVLDLRADRMSSHHLASNQLRLWLAAFAYLLLERLRAVGCRGTQLARATVGTIRLRLLKVAAEVTVSVRRIFVRYSAAYPLQALFRQCHRRLRKLAKPAG